MARRGRKRAAAESPPKPKATTAAEAAEAAEASNASEVKDDTASKSVERLRAFNNQEVERRIAAIRAIQVAEVESLLSRMRLIRSYLTKEQLETPALQFFQENFPNISVIRNEKYKMLELEWKNQGGNGGNVQASVDVSANMQFGGGGIPLSVRSVKSHFLDLANLHIPDFVLDAASENQMPGARDAFQTPGDTGSRLSFGMTPKTGRLPKNGEMLMSVRGSPLGVYQKEDNLEAIHESGAGSQEGTSQ